MSATRGERRRAERRADALHHRCEQMKAFARAHPWRGDTPLLDARYTWDTDALLEPGRPTRILCSLDVGYHASCWFKNADYERCLHVSISHPRVERPRIIQRDPTDTIGPHLGYELDAPSDAETRAWGRAFFGDDARKAWVEPPASTLDIYRAPGVAHIRLFLNDDLEPILPEGEVYDLKPWRPDDPILDRAGGDVR